MIFFSGGIIAVLLIIALLKKDQSEYLKLFLFCGMVVPTVLTTAYLAAATVAENKSSATGGPVHWHADFQIYSCGQPVKLKKPTGLSNRIGTPLMHEHGDNRIHVEGTVQDLTRVSLGNFFESIGGKLTNTLLVVPTDNGDFIMQNKMNCPQGGQPALQIFAYKADEQTKPSISAGLPRLLLIMVSTRMLNNLSPSTSLGTFDYLVCGRSFVPNKTQTMSEVRAIART